MCECVTRYLVVFVKLQFQFSEPIGLHTSPTFDGGCNFFLFKARPTLQTRVSPSLETNRYIPHWRSGLSGLETPLVGLFSSYLGRLITDHVPTKWSGTDRPGPVHSASGCCCCHQQQSRSTGLPIRLEPVELVAAL